jgi:uncharacterized membrane protein
VSVYEQRLTRFEQRLRELEAELAELRRTAPTGTARPARPLDPVPAHLAMSDLLAERPGTGRDAAPSPVAVDLTEPPATPPRDFPSEREPFDLSRLLGARALALTGGVVSLLGIVFFFVLSVQRGWVGPVGRVSLGAIASALALGAGWWLRRRFGETFAATAAAGVGIAGAYATLLAAAARYDLVSDPVALALAALIAAVATATALMWSDQALAGLGLVGAILAPLAVAVGEDGLAATGVGFAVLMLAAARSVA